MIFDPLRRTAAYVTKRAVRCLASFHLAVDWKIMPYCPKVHLEPENEREELMTPEREALLLKHAGRTLGDVIIMVQDTGARPEEIFRIRIENIHLGEYHIFNPHGKTKNSKRYFPISDRMVELIQRRCGDRKEGWLFPSDAKCGHLTTVAKMFRIARRKAGLPNTVVLYSARHTFGTDLQDQSKNLAVTMSDGAQQPENNYALSAPRVRRCCARSDQSAQRGERCWSSFGQEVIGRTSEECVSALKSGADDRT